MVLEALLFACLLSLSSGQNDQNFKDTVSLSELLLNSKKSIRLSSIVTASLIIITFLSFIIPVTVYHNFMLFL